MSSRWLARGRMGPYSSRSPWDSWGSIVGDRVRHLEQDGSPALHSPISTVIAGGSGRRGMSGHLLHRGQVDAQVQQISDPGSAQVVRCRSLDLALPAALPADPPGGGGAEPSQAGIGANQAAGLQHGAEERAWFRATNL